MSQNPFLQGNFAPVSDQQQCDELAITGELPAALQGVYIQNGPNPQFPTSGRYHPFDGDGMLHAVYLEQGKARYRNRYVQTHAYQQEQAAGQPLWTGLLEPLQTHPPQGRFKNPANTALIQHAGKTLALWEQGLPYSIHPDSLETLGEYDFNGQLQHPMTAHPKHDPLTGELFVFGYQTRQPPYLWYSVFSRQGELLQQAPVDLPRSVMMHDFAVTDDYVILLDLPYTFGIQQLLNKGALGGFDASQPARIGIMSRHAEQPLQTNAEAAYKKVTWIDIEPCYVFHIINAYQSINDQQSAQIVVDVCRYEDLQMPINPINDQPVNYQQLLRSDNQQPRVCRWLIDLDKRSLIEVALSESSMELPRLNPGYSGKPYRYAYLAQLSSKSLLPVGSGYVKLDVQQRCQWVHQHGEGRYGGEATFVADPDSEAEDAGWLMGFVYDQATGHSDFVVACAQNLEQAPLAVVHLPLRVPYGIHGIWLPLA